MATLTLSYDGRNRTARSIVEILRTLDFFSITEATMSPKRKSGIELAYEDVAAGRVYHAKDGEDLIRQCLADGTMYTVNYTSQFKRAVKRCIKRGLDVNKIAQLVDMLAETGTLPREYRPHKLSGFKGNRTWECHIEPDWLMVWEQNDNSLTLLMLDTGTHADLF